MRDAVLVAFEEARLVYNSQAIPVAYESGHHSQAKDASVKRFAKQLHRCATERDVKQAVIARVKSKRSIWDSHFISHTYSFNTHFIDALRNHCPAMYRHAIKAVFGVSMLGGRDVVLYRGDTRSPRTIFKEGFKPKLYNGYVRDRAEQFRGRYTSSSSFVSTDSIGVSTSKHQEAACAFVNDKGYVYTIKFTANQLEDCGIRAVDIHDTWKDDSARFYHNKWRAEVNFIDPIPPEYIVSATHKGTQKRLINRNSNQHKLTLECKSSPKNAGSEDDTRNGYDAVTGAIHLVSYQCDIRLCKDDSTSFDFIFSNRPDAAFFVCDRNIREEREPFGPKGVMFYRYPGLFAVRLSRSQYQAVKADMVELPDESVIVSAPKMTI